MSLQDLRFNGSQYEDYGHLIHGAVYCDKHSYFGIIYGLSEYVGEIGPVANRVQVGAIHLLQIWMQLLGIYKMSKTNMLLSSL
jgi:hypothetical protein